MENTLGNSLENTRTLGANPDADTEAAPNLQAAIEQMFEKMERVNARIERNQIDIERLKSETQTMLAELRAVV